MLSSKKQWENPEAWSILASKEKDISPDAGRKAQQAREKDDTWTGQTKDDVKGKRMRRIREVDKGKEMGERDTERVTGVYMREGKKRK